MKFCSTCGKELLNEAVVCPHCGCAVANPAAPQEDQVSVGFCILSVFIPLFGILYWASKHHETPKRAGACGIAAIISWVVSYLIAAAYSAYLVAYILYL